LSQDSRLGDEVTETGDYPCRNCFTGGQKATAQTADYSQAIKINPNLAAALRLRFFSIDLLLISSAPAALRIGTYRVLPCVGSLRGLCWHDDKSYYLAARTPVPIAHFCTELFGAGSIGIGGSDFFAVASFHIMVGKCGVALCLKLLHKLPRLVRPLELAVLYSPIDVSCSLAGESCFAKGA